LKENIQESDDINGSNKIQNLNMWRFIKMEFNERVWEAIREMIELGYKPTVLINMINESNEIDTVKRLINNPRMSYGFSRLWKLGALHLSMEAIILEEDWITLFTEDERMKARIKLRQYDYNILKKCSISS
jgi:hypothetical protein